MPRSLDGWMPVTECEEPRQSLCREVVVLTDITILIPHHVNSRLLASHPSAAEPRPVKPARPSAAASNGPDSRHKSISSTWDDCVHVAVRLRPLNAREKARGDAGRCVWVGDDGRSVSVTHPETGATRDFRFHQVCWPALAHWPEGLALELAILACIDSRMTIVVSYFGCAACSLMLGFCFVAYLRFGF